MDLKNFYWYYLLFIDVLFNFLLIVTFCHELYSFPIFFKGCHFFKYLYQIFFNFTICIELTLPIFPDETLDQLILNKRSSLIASLHNFNMISNLCLHYT